MSEVKNKIPEHIDDKLFTVKYNCDKETHLKPNQEDCKVCKDRPCTYCCPANVYSWDEDQQKNLVGFENCLECGACRVVCPARTLDWKYPKAGFGVTFKYG